MNIEYPLLTVQDVADRLQVSKKYVLSLIKDYKLDAYDISVSDARKRAVYRISEEDFQSFLKFRATRVGRPERARRNLAPEHPPVHNWIDHNPKAQLLTIKEAAERLRIKPDHVHQIIAYNHLRGIEIGQTSNGHSKMRVREDDLDDFIYRVTLNPKRPWHKLIPVPDRVKAIIAKDEANEMERRREFKDIEKII